MIDKKENIQLVVDALKANKKKAIRMMRDKDGGRCCLCVMEDTLKDKYPEKYEGVDMGNFVPNCGILNELLGFHSSTIFTIDGEQAILANHNDGFECEQIAEKTHVRIAEAIEEEFLVDTP